MYDDIIWIYSFSGTYLLPQVVPVQSIFSFFDNIDTSYQPLCLKIGTTTHIVHDSSSTKVRATKIKTRLNDA